MAKKEVIGTKFKDRIDAIGISMKNWLNGMIFEKMSLITLMTSFSKIIKMAVNEKMETTG